MPDELRFKLLILAVSDLERAVHFYKAAFGWPKSLQAPAYAELAMPGGLRLGLYRREPFGANTGTVPVPVPQGSLAPVELYFQTDDVETAIARVSEAGGRTLSPLSERSWGDDAAYFADPDGNVIVIARPRMRRSPEPDPRHM
jgi:predicted enzyme related to lactoylglutathione lyase